MQSFILQECSWKGGEGRRRQSNGDWYPEPGQSPGTRPIPKRLILTWHLSSLVFAMHEVLEWPWPYQSLFQLMCSHTGCPVELQALSLEWQGHTILFIHKVTGSISHVDMIHVLFKLSSNLELSWWCFNLGDNWNFEKGEVDPREQTNTERIQHSPGFSCREENPVSRKILTSRWLAELSGPSQGNTHRLHSVSHTCNWAINAPTVWFSIKKLIWVRCHWRAGGWGDDYQEATTEQNRLVWWLVQNSMCNNDFLSFKMSMPNLYALQIQFPTWQRGLCPSD